MGCVCTQSERVMRAYAAKHPLPKMTPQQRQWCFDQIVDPEFDLPSNYTDSTDDVLARAVLFHWRDIARDKGLL